MRQIEKIRKYGSGRTVRKVNGFISHIFARSATTFRAWYKPGKQGALSARGKSSRLFSVKNKKITCEDFCFVLK